MTSPYRFYQFWINADDRDLSKFMRYFTMKSQAEVEELEATYSEDPQSLKRILAEELTKRVHSEEAYESVLKSNGFCYLHVKRVRSSLLGLDKGELALVADENPKLPH